MLELIKGSFVAIIFKVLSAVALLILNILLARLLDAEGSGMFFLSLTVITLAAALGRIGMENTLVKFIAGNLVSNRYGKVIGVYKKALTYAFTVSLVTSLVLFSLAPWLSISIFNKPELLNTLRIMSLSVVPLALLTLHAYALQGLKKIALSIVVLSLMVPAITGTISLFFVTDFGIKAASWAYLISTILTLFAGYYFWKSNAPEISIHKPYFDSRELLNTSFPLYAVVLMNMLILWAPLLLLGVWDTSENVGIFSAASRTAMLTSFVLVAINSIAAPKFAALYESGDMVALARLVRESTKIMVLCGLPIFLFFVFFPEWVLSFFGEQFEKGYSVLIILSIGQFINVASGSVAYLLMMSGNEKMMRNILFICTSIITILSIYLIPQYGMIGAALSMAITLSIQNFIAMFIVWKKLNILTIPGLNRFIH